MRTPALFLASILLAGACSDETPSDDPEDSVFVDDGKADDFFSTSAQEYLLEGKSTVVLDASYATKTDAERLDAAKKLIELKQIAIAWFVTQYLVDKEDTDTNKSFGGFGGMAKAGELSDFGVSARADGLTYDFTFRQLAAGGKNMMSLLPVHASGSTNAFSLDIGRPTNDEMGHLEVDAFAAGLRRHEHSRLAGEGFLSPVALLDRHTAVQDRDRNAHRLEELDDHRLGRQEFRENEDLHERIVLVLGDLDKKLIEPVELDVQTLLLSVGRQTDEALDGRSLIAHRRELGVQQQLELLIRLGFPKVVVQAKLGRTLDYPEPPLHATERDQALLKRDLDGTGAARDDPLHEQHEEHQGVVLLAPTKVIALAHIGGDFVVKLPLARPIARPVENDFLRRAGLEERLTIAVDRNPFGRPHDVWLDAGWSDRRVSDELLLIKE